jgi:hypothetical protein
MKRIATIFAAKDLGASGTEVININLKGLISRITMIWKATVNTVSVMLAPMLAAITKVELIDGSRIIHSISGVDLQAANFYDHKRMPYNKLSLTASDYHICEFSLDFGRQLWDTQYALDPQRFDNLQLRITWDEDAANTGIDTNSFEVYAYVDEARIVNPIGFLSYEEISQHAMAASSHEYDDLPTDAVIRKLLIKGYSTDHDPLALFSNFKLSIDNDRIVPLDIDAETYWRIISREYPLIVEPITLDAAVTAKTIYANVSKDIIIAVDYDETNFVTAQSHFSVPTITGAKIALAASVDIKGETAIITGKCPHNIFPIQFGLPGESSTWLPANTYGSLRTDFTYSGDADSGDTMYLLAQRVKTY